MSSIRHYQGAYYIDGRSFRGSESDLLGAGSFSVASPSKNVFLVPMLQILSTLLEKSPVQMRMRIEHKK